MGAARGARPGRCVATRRLAICARMMNTPRTHHKRDRPPTEGEEPVSAKALAFERTGRDSNPRYAFTHTHFPGVHLKPLGHPSSNCASHERREVAAHDASCASNNAPGNGIPARCWTDRVGFEPTVPLPAHRFSRPAPSTTRTPVQDRHQSYRVTKRESTHYQPGEATTRRRRSASRKSCSGARYSSGALFLGSQLWRGAPRRKEGA